MRSFKLTLTGGEYIEPKNIEFRAPDPLRAFDILEWEAVGRTAILWEGEKRLATLRRTHAGGWQLTA